MSPFLSRLGPRPSNDTVRRWVYVPYDQLHGDLGLLAATPPRELGVVFVESSARPAERPYHQQKLALLLANQRHFALELAARGVAVDFRAGPAPFAAQLASAVADRGPLQLHRPAERCLRAELAPLLADGRLVEHPHPGWLTTPADFDALGAAPWRMDAFYRRVRRRTGDLMDDRGKPVGGRFSFDGENRQRWTGDPAPPTPPAFTPDAVTAEVVDLVRCRFASHPGRVDPSALPATRDDAERMWTWALSECLPTFGPYEDAMTTRSRGLFHTRISPLLNLHRLLPARVLGDVLARQDAIPLNSLEGFVRQLLGWREFVHHVHERTPEMAGSPNHLGQHTPLPPAFWPGAPSGMACLDTVVSDVWDEAWSHHITRLMVLSNVAQLLDVSPRELTDWFWVAYSDTYDWVVEPNVLGMGTFALGDRMTTKPYISGSGYLSKMSDYCGGCAFDPKTSCPLKRLYWAYLGRHRGALAGNRRMALPLRSQAKRSPEEQAKDAATYEATRAALAKGERLTGFPRE